MVDELSLLCDPGVSLKPKISEITGITDLMLRGKESPAEGVRKLLDFIGDCPVAAHNAPFDMGMLQAECKRMGRELSRAGAGHAHLLAQALPPAKEP